MKKYIPLYLIPYPIVDVKDQNKMARIKVRPNPTYLKIDESIKDTKYLQPSKEHLHNGSHLYILKSELQKIQSPKCNLILVEGEKKALKVIQELKKIEDRIGKFAVIGISGIHNWLHAPEWDLINLRGRKAIIFFDADSERNIAVVEAEIQLAGYLYFQGASQVASARWDLRKGKGIDDLLVQEPNPPARLQEIIENAQDTIASYRGRIQDRDIAKNFFLRIFEKKPSISEASLENLSAILEDTGIKKTVIRSAIKIAKTEIEEKLIEKHKEKIKEVFGVENIQVPSDFLWEDGFLKTKKGKIITEFFIVKAVAEGINNTEGIIIKTITGKEIFLSTQEKELKQLFLNHGVWIGDATLWMVSQYIAEYIYKNQGNIEKVKYSNQIGWKEENGNLLYIAPQTTKEYVFDPNLRGYTASGDREKEKETLIKIFQRGSIIGLGYLGAIASLLIKPLEDVGARNFIVFIEGTAGKGKTTTAKFGLSLFGHPEKIFSNVNTTNTGAEILFSTRKDSLILLDEINTGGHHISEHLIKIIYDFESGLGRIRGTPQINLRRTNTYRGVLFLTSENSLENMIKKSDKTAMGTYRRSVIINFSNKQIDEEDIKTIYESIYQNHGNLLKDITDYILSQITFLKEKYNEYRKQAQQLYKFSGQDNHFALLYCALHVLEDILGENFPEMTLTLSQIAKENSEYYQELTEMTKEKLQQLIKNFISKNLSYFPTDIGGNIPQSIYGKEDGNTLYITPLGLEHLSDYLKLDIKSLKKLLIDFGMAETDENRLIKRTSFSIAGRKMKFNAYRIQLSDDTTEETDKEAIDI
jgi:uncharacterized protein (DUF927 family)